MLFIDGAGINREEIVNWSGEYLLEVEGENRGFV